MVAFIDQHKEEYGVEPMCSVLPIAPATFYEHARRKREPQRRPAREKRDDELRTEIGRVYEENQLVYGATKVWKQLRRENIAALGHRPLGRLPVGSPAFEAAERR